MFLKRVYCNNREGYCESCKHMCSVADIFNSTDLMFIPITKTWDIMAGNHLVHRFHITQEIVLIVIEIIIIV